MHTLEPEYQELKTKGCIDEATALRAIAIDRGSLFSVFSELRFALYVAVAAITAGIGLVLKDNLDRIGPVTLMAALAFIAAACYANAIHTKRSAKERSIGGDYVLLLGALILSAVVGYGESRFHWFGAHWSWHLLVLALFHAATAYYFNSRLVLSVSLTSLAGWFGIQGDLDSLFGYNSSLHETGMHALACAGVIIGWREVHRRTSQPQPFIEVLEHFAANTGFWGALALSFHNQTRVVGILIVIGMAIVSIRKGLESRQEAFVVYGIAYATLGLCVFETHFVRTPLLLVLLELITIVAAATQLWRFHAQLKVKAE